MIRIAARHEVSSLLVRGSFARVISINQPGEEPPGMVAPFKGKKLILHFDDLIEEVPLLGGPKIVLPSKEHVREVLRFAKETEGNLLVHCTMGRSRSAACVLAVIADEEPKTIEGAQNAKRRLLEIKSSVRPNSRLVNFTDEILEFGGLLIAQFSE